MWRAWLLPRPPRPMIPTVTAEFALVVAAETDRAAADWISPRLVSVLGSMAPPPRTSIGGRPVCAGRRAAREAGNPCAADRRSVPGTPPGPSLSFARRGAGCHAQLRREPAHRRLHLPAHVHQTAGPVTVNPMWLGPEHPRSDPTSNRLCVAVGRSDGNRPFGILQAAAAPLR